MSISLGLVNEYKSFPAGYSQEFDGDLIVLSGVNGSGKSHIADIIKGNNRSNVSDIIDRTLMINGENVSQEYVLLKDFMSSISIGNLSSDSMQFLQNARNAAWNAYTNINPERFSRMSCAGYFTASQKLKERLIRVFTIDKFNNGIPRNEFDRFVGDNDWQPDDLFSANIVSIFRNATIMNFRNPSDDDIEPWGKLNALFLELKFSYRFEDNYYLSDVSLELDRDVRLYSVDSDGKADLSCPRELIDLSSGEKSIISLTFGSLMYAEKRNKIVIFDEYDAVLNPSLTAALFKVVKLFFIDQGIPVVFITHSITSITLAPDYAKFYEVINPPVNGLRVQSVDADSYTEMKVAHKKFYDDKVSYISQIKALEEEEIRLREIINSSNGLEKTIVFCEGKTDEAYLKCAVEVLKIDDRFDIQWVGHECDGKVIFTGQNSLDHLRDSALANPNIYKRKIILLYDCDSSHEKVVSDEIFNTAHNDSLYSLRISRTTNPITKGIENLLPSSCIERVRSSEIKLIKRTTHEEDGQEITNYKVEDKSKVKLQKLICDEKVDSDFEDFRILFVKLNEVIDRKTQ
jgi:hypothetical protein